MDAIECFHRMNSELAGEINTHGEQAKWAVGGRLSSHAWSVCVIDLLQISNNVAM
jgi:hypothetical protein